MKSIDLNISLEQFLFGCPECRWFMEELGMAPDEHPGKSLADICRIHGLEPQTTAQMLAAFRAGMSSVPAVSVELMTLTELCNHLERGNHAHLRADLMVLDQMTQTAVKLYAGDDPGLLTIRKNFTAFRKKFAAHLSREVERVFPIIRRLDATKAGTPRARAALKVPLARIEQEHGETNDCLADLRALIQSCAPRSSHVGVRRTIFDAFARLEDRIHEQIYMEDHVLYPRTLAIRKAL